MANSADKEELSEPQPAKASSGLYPTGKKKVITPISVSSPDDNDAEGATKAKSKPAKSSKNSAKASAKPKAKTVKSVLDNTSDADKSTVAQGVAVSALASESELTDHPDMLKEEQSDEAKPKEAVAETDDHSSAEGEDKSKKQAVVQHKFVDEGQYHITVPKKFRKQEKSSPIKKLFVILLIVTLLSLAVYLYLEFFDIEIKPFINLITELIRL